MNTLQNQRVKEYSKKQEIIRNRVLDAENKRNETWISLLTSPILENFASKFKQPKKLLLGRKSIIAWLMKPTQWKLVNDIKISFEKRMRKLFKSEMQRKIQFESFMSKSIDFTQNGIFRIGDKIQLILYKRSVKNVKITGISSSHIKFSYNDDYNSFYSVEVHQEEYINKQRVLFKNKNWEASVLNPRWSFFTSLFQNGKTVYIIRITGQRRGELLESKVEYSKHTGGYGNFQVTLPNKQILYFSFYDFYYQFRSSCRDFEIDFMKHLFMKQHILECMEMVLNRKASSFGSFITSFLKCVQKYL